MDSIEQLYILYFLRIYQTCFEIDSQLQQPSTISATLQLKHQSVYFVNFTPHLILTHEHEPPCELPVYCREGIACPCDTLPRGQTNSVYTESVSVVIFSRVFSHQSHTPVMEQLSSYFNRLAGYSCYTCLLCRHTQSIGAAAANMLLTLHFLCRHGVGTVQLTPGLQYMCIC